MILSLSYHSRGCQRTGNTRKFSVYFRNFLVRYQNWDIFQHSPSLSEYLQQRAFQVIPLTTVEHQCIPVHSIFFLNIPILFSNWVLTRKISEWLGKKMEISGALAPSFLPTCRSEIAHSAVSRISQKLVRNKTYLKQFPTLYAWKLNK